MIGLAVLSLAWGTIATSQTPADLELAKRLVGAWRLVTVSAAATGPQSPDGAPIGLIIYDASGAMSAQVVRNTNRNRRAGAIWTGPEAVAAIEDFSSYFGTYTVDAAKGTITHHKQAVLNPDRSLLVVRQYQFKSDDLLVLTPLNQPTKHLTFQRMKKP